MDFPTLLLYIFAFGSLIQILLFWFLSKFIFKIPAAFTTDFFIFLIPSLLNIFIILSFYLVDDIQLKNIIIAGGIFFTYTLFSHVFTQKFKTTVSTNLGIFLSFYLLFLGAIYLLSTHVFTVIKTDGNSMHPTITDQSLILVNKWANKSSLQQDDIIYFQAPTEEGGVYVKRIVGLPASQVPPQSLIDKDLSPNKLVLDEHGVFVNSREISQNYLPANLDLGFPDHEHFSLEIENNYFFVLGDNRRHSLDSRDFGMIHKSNIIGTYWMKIR